MPEMDEPLEEERPKIKTILVVEDDADRGEFLVQALKDETPYQAVLAPDGFQALKMVRTLKPHLFVLDYLLPRMNGLELYDQLHTMEGLETIPALLMSANLPAKELEKRRVSAITKPFELEELLQTIEKLLAE